MGEYTFLIGSIFEEKILLELHGLQQKSPGKSIPWSDVFQTLGRTLGLRKEESRRILFGCDFVETSTRGLRLRQSTTAWFLQYEIWLEQVALEKEMESDWDEKNKREDTCSKETENPQGEQAKDTQRIRSIMFILRLWRWIPTIVGWRINHSTDTDTWPRAANSCLCETEKEWSHHRFCRDF